MTTKTIEQKNHIPEGERLLRLPEFARLLGYQVSTIRKKISRGEVSYYKPGRILLIPESEASRLLGNLHRAIDHA